MRAQLDAIADEEIPIALLLAAEWPIHGRFGCGPAVDACGFEVDTATARFRAPATGSIELVGPVELRPELEAVHESRRVRTPGAVRREAFVWDRIAGLATWPGQTATAGSTTRSPLSRRWSSRRVGRPLGPRGRALAARPRA